VGTITVSDSTEIYFKDWGEGPVVTFSHGWPLSADQWDPQMLFLADHGFRCIAHDRRGHGRSSQPSSGNNLDTYADDLAELIEALDLHDVTMVGHSTGGGEVTRYIGRYGTARVKQAVLISAVPTLLIHGDDDQVVPVNNSERSARIIPNAKDIYYPGAPHGLTTTHQDQVNADLLTFLES
jgi:non-heme chloroperoxidase